MTLDRRIFPIAALLVVGGCSSAEAPKDQGDDHGHDHGDGGHDHGGEASWAVTAWGEHFEIFAEADPLVAGEVSKSHTHVTIMRDFSPLRDGLVEIILRRDGEETVFTEELPLRDGIFDVSIRPETEGVYDLSFRVEGAVRTEKIPAGTVRVGNASDPGGLEGAEADPGGEVIAFLKEQQWQTAFSTAWALEGDLHLVARGPGRVRPMAGGEVVLAAPMSAVVGGEPWPHVGREVAASEPLFALTPHVAADRSLAELESVETERRAELGVAEERLKRLESLLPVQATSPAEVEAARARVTALRAQHQAARSDLDTARSGRSGGAAIGATVSVVTPFAGQIADVRVSPGQIVAAGQTLGRVVRVEPFWVEVFLRPGYAIELDGGGTGLSLRGPGMSESVTVEPERVRLVSKSPEVDSRQGTVTCTFEVAGNASPLLGSAVEAEVTLPQTRSGIVVPASAIVDDGGTDVVYLQLDGEGFLRRQVEISLRQGSSLLVRGVDAGERVVTVGGSAIRRATLVSSGVGHGHVH
jgi:RND family efflux transporter MFP subunit